MKKIMILVFATVMFFGGMHLSYASDWDKAGKVLTGIEGLRILTGGNIDLVGTLIGAGRHVKNDIYHSNRRLHEHRRYAKRRSTCKKTWVPHYEWEKVHVPAHEAYDDEYGKIYVEEHYFKYKVEAGGHWEKSYSCH